jgi:hypothetical protein
MLKKNTIASKMKLQAASQGRLFRYKREIRIT